MSTAEITWYDVESRLKEELEAERQNLLGADENISIEANDTAIQKTMNMLIYNYDLCTVLGSNLYLGYPDSDCLQCTDNIFDAIRFSIESELRDLAADWIKEQKEVNV